MRGASLVQICGAHKMAGRLTVQGIRRLAVGKHADGAGLYLFVDERPQEYWRWFYIFSWRGRRPEMSLGCLRDVTLAEARQAASEARAMVRAGKNPIDERRAAVRAVSGATFGEIADEYFASKQTEYRNDKYREMVRRSLVNGLAQLRSLTFDAIETETILRVLKPVWNETPETAKRLREKIEAIIDAATAKGLRRGDNPARWKGHLEHLLPKRQKVEKTHHAAMPYRDLPTFWARLRKVETVAAMALQFTILTAARSGEVYGATWDEIDLVNKVWTLPPSRMKAGRSHRVPLCDAAIEVLQKCATIRVNDYVFAGQRKDKPLSHVSMANVLSRLGVDNATPHGFRSAFRDFAGNETHFAREVCEAALAHSVGDSAEQAYRREDALEKRRQLMSVWASYVCGDGKVVPMRRKV